MKYNSKLLWKTSGTITQVYQMLSIYSSSNGITCLLNMDPKKMKEFGDNALFVFPTHVEEWEHNTSNTAENWRRIKRVYRKN